MARGVVGLAPAALRMLSYFPKLSKTLLSFPDRLTQFHYFQRYFSTNSEYFLNIRFSTKVACASQRRLCITISVPGGHSYKYISTHKILNAVSAELKILFESLFHVSLSCASYFFSSVQLHFHLLLFNHIMSHCFTTFINHVTFTSFSFPFRLSANLSMLF